MLSAKRQLPPSAFSDTFKGSTETDVVIAAEMPLHVSAYNLTRVMNIIGIKPLMDAIRA